MTKQTGSARKPKFKYGQRVLVKAIIGPSGETGDDGVFVRVNTEDPEIWVHVNDIIPVTVKRDKRASR
jgi:hypothetical protein